MKTVYLHIGLNKAGSTTLQKFLFQNKDALFSKGYLILNTGIPKQELFPQHYNLARCLRARDSHDLISGLWSEVHQEILSTPAKKIIITSECFCELPESCIKDLKQELAPYHVKIIVYLRRQDTRAISWYAELVKAGYCWQSIDEAWERVTCDADYMRKLSIWADCFHGDNICVRPLEKYQIQDICQDFLRQIGIDNGVEFKGLRNQNISANQKVIEILRFMNEVFIQKMKLPRERWWHYDAYLIKAFFNRRLFKDDRRIYGFGVRERCLKLLERLEESDSEVARCYLRRDDGVLFYERSDLSSPDAPSFLIEQLTDEDFAEIVACLSEAFSSKTGNEGNAPLPTFCPEGTTTNEKKFESFLSHLLE